MRIEKKIWPEYFEKVQSGEKKFELRLADFEINIGDTLILREWDPKTKEYTGRRLEKEVTLVRKTKDAVFYSKEDIQKYGWQIIQIDKN